MKIKKRGNSPVEMAEVPAQLGMKEDKFKAQKPENSNKLLSCVDLELDLERSKNIMENSYAWQEKTWL